MTSQVGRVAYRHDGPVASNEFWANIRNPNAGAVTLMRIGETDRGPAITAVVVVGSDLTSHTLKKVSFSAVPLRNLGAMDPSQWLIASGEHQPPALRELTGAIESALKSAEATHRPERLIASTRPRLTRPDRSDPDGHAEAVAASYAEHVHAGRQPGMAIAEEAGVPVATARGWIREARRRGKLPKGRRGVWLGRPSRRSLGPYQ